VDSTATTRTTKVIVASTVMLSFISFWRAAAIVLCDMASSAFYAGGIAETFVGKSAPWFILAIMLFAYAVRAVYIEGCTMFVRGGVYRVVREAMGPRLAKIAVSALLFDYVLTGPISGVSAGLYLAGLINETVLYFGHAHWQVYPPYFAAGFAMLATI
jgi:amino acid transporter